MPRLLFVGAVYLATHGFPARYLATAIGFTQCMGMLGGSAGQFGVAPLVHGVMSWQQFWFYSGLLALVIMVVMLVVTPRREDRTRPGSIWTMFDPYKTVLTNPQSYLCGFSSGLLFLPTTVGGMIWGVAFLRQGWHIDYAEAVNRASMIPLRCGWSVRRCWATSPTISAPASPSSSPKWRDAGCALAILTYHPTACRLTCPAFCRLRLRSGDDPLFNDQRSQSGRSKGAPQER